MDGSSSRHVRSKSTGDKPGFTRQQFEQSGSRGASGEETTPETSGTPNRTPRFGPLLTVETEGSSSGDITKGLTFQDFIDSQSAEHVSSPGQSKSRDSSPKGNVSPKRDIGRPASPALTIDATSVISEEDAQARSLELKKILALGRINDIKSELNSTFNRPIENIGIKDIRNCCIHVGLKLEECFQDFRTFKAIYEGAKIKDPVIDTLISLTPEQANQWNKDNESKEAISKGLEQEEVLKAYEEIQRRFGSDSLKTICDKLRAMNPHIQTQLGETEQTVEATNPGAQTQSGETEQTVEAIPEILKSERTTDLEKKVAMLEEAIKQYSSEEGTQGIFSEDNLEIQVNKDGIDKLTLNEGLIIERGRIAEGAITAANGALEFASALSSAIKGAMGVSNVENAFNVTGEILSIDAKKGYEGLRDMAVGVGDMTKGAVDKLKEINRQKDEKRQKDDLKRRVNELINLRKEIKKKHVVDNADIIDELIPSPIKRAKNLSDYIDVNERIRRAKEDAVSGREKLERKRREAKANLEVEKEKDKIINNLTFLFTKATISASEAAGGMVHIPDRRMPAYWRKVRDVIDNLVKDVPSGGRSLLDAHGDKLFGVLLADMAVKQLSRKSPRRAWARTRRRALIATTFSTSRRNNSRKDVEGAIALLFGEAKGRRKFIRRNYARRVYPGGINVNSDPSSESDARDLSEARADEIIRRNRRLYNIKDKKIKAQLILCDEICTKEMELKHSVQDYRTQMCGDVLAARITIAKALNAYDDYCTIVKELPKNTVEELIERLTHEARATQFLAMISVFHGQMNSEIANSTKVQDTAKKMKEIQDEIAKSIQGYTGSLSPGVTMVSEGIEFAELVLATGAKTASFATLA